MSAWKEEDEMGSAAQVQRVVQGRVTRPFVWSVRRELWENKSIYLAPAVVAGLMLLLSLAGQVTIAHDADGIGPKALAGYIDLDSGIAMLTVAVSLLIGFIYCVDALYGERIDHSILFWKSLPVSDTTVVLSKASIPGVVLPVVAFVSVVAAQVLLHVFGSVIFLVGRLPIAEFWTLLPPLKIDGLLIYGLMALTAWYAPIYGWLILISGWSRRRPIKWVILPPVVLIVVERVAFHTSRLARALGYCFRGVFHEAFASGAKGHGNFLWLSHPTPMRLLSSMHLWVGLALAAVFLAAAVRLRRYREPI